MALAGGPPTKAFVEDFPPYCCVILRESATGAIFLEQRPDTAKVAAGKLTCFGGKREDDETPLACIQREVKEELGFTLRDDDIARAVDLFVDGKLIAWFYQHPAPARDAELVFEEGREGVWLSEAEVEADPSSISPWHSEVLRAYRKGVTRADYES